SLKIGIPEGYALRFVEPDKQKPIIVYGTSIAQGASASRPGLAWTAILKREFDRPVINLGFSGNGRLEAPVVDYICQVDAAIYILDCIPNMCGMLSTIAPRITEAVEKIRKVSSSPIIITEHCGTLHAEASPKSDEAHVLGNKECRKAYEQLKKQGVKGLYYLSKEDIGLSMDASIDGWHPNDVGMFEYAEAYKKVIKKALK
ncbi:MAG: acetylhydrolase, partial [Alistipes sp.]|nr:acetylhydrolase [Alistipes sp.]